MEFIGLTCAMSSNPVPSDPAPAFSTADLCDLVENSGEELRVAEPVLRDFGGLLAFHGSIATLRCPEDNSLVRGALENPGAGRVLVVDGGGSTRCALLGDQLAALALERGWSGVVIWGCVRDSAALRRMPLGVKALAAQPCRSAKRGAGQAGSVLRFAGIEFQPGWHLYADADGIVLAARALHAVAATGGGGPGA